MTNKKLPIFVSIRTAARELGLGEKWLRAAVKAGTVPGIQVGTQFKVHLPQLIDQLTKEVSA